MHRHLKSHEPTADTVLVEQPIRDLNFYLRPLKEQEASLHVPTSRMSDEEHARWLEWARDYRRRNGERLDALDRRHAQ